MSFILVPKIGSDLQINGWNWRPTLLLLLEAGLLGEEQYERMGAQGCGGRADAAQCGRFAGAVDAQLERMKPDDRMRADLSVTNTPKPTDVLGDPNEIYSSSYHWLVTFRDFCHACGGFEVR